MSLPSESGHEVVVLATAHPAKFREAVVQATGQEPELLPALARMQGAETRCQKLPASARSVHDHMQRTLHIRGTSMHSDGQPPPEPCKAQKGESGSDPTDL